MRNVSLCVEFVLGVGATLDSSRAQRLDDRGCTSQERIGVLGRLKAVV